MRVDTVSFQKRQRFLSPKSQKNLKSILENINAETKMNKNDFCWESNFVKSFSLKYKNFKLIDGRMYVNKVNQKKQLVRESLVDIGKTQLVIDNKSGEIIDYRKSFFKPWSKVLKTLEQALEIIKCNYNNPEIVQKQRLSLSGFTPKGVRKLKIIKG